MAGRVTLGDCRFSPDTYMDSPSALTPVFQSVRSYSRDTLTAETVHSSSNETGYISTRVMNWYANFEILVVDATSSSSPFDVRIFVRV